MKAAVKTVGTTAVKEIQKGITRAATRRQDGNSVIAKIIQATATPVIRKTGKVHSPLKTGTLMAHPKKEARAATRRGEAMAAGLWAKAPGTMEAGIQAKGPNTADTAAEDLHSGEVSAKEPMKAAGHSGMEKADVLSRKEKKEEVSVPEDRQAGSLSGTAPGRTPLQGKAGNQALRQEKAA